MNYSFIHHSIMRFTHRGLSNHLVRWWIFRVLFLSLFFPCRLQYRPPPFLQTSLYPNSYNCFTISSLSASNFARSVISDERRASMSSGSGSDAWASLGSPLYPPLVRGAIYWAFSPVIFSQRLSGSKTVSQISHRVCAYQLDHCLHRVMMASELVMRSDLRASLVGVLRRGNFSSDKFVLFTFVPNSSINCLWQLCELNIQNK